LKHILKTWVFQFGATIFQIFLKVKYYGKKNGKGYFSANINNYPSHSVGFWISDVDLRYSNGSYIYENNGISRQIVYKGNQTALQVIPKGRLIRLSLAKWWKPEDSDIEARCYLQLSGWYEDQTEPVKTVEVKPIVKVQPITKSNELPKNEVPKYQAPKTTQQPKNTNGSCYIATLCYDDFYADEVCSFRDFRDITLSKTKLGRQFIVQYYQFAPKLNTRFK
jgi:hypothetical protein